MADTIVINGKEFAAKIRASVKQKVKKLVHKYGILPKLAVILVGDDPASHIYIKNKDKALVEAGMASQQYSLQESTSEKKLLKLIEQLNADDDTHGILVQLPLPKHIAVDTVINAINPEKDVDGFSVINIGRRSAGFSSVVTPCTPLGCMLLLKDLLGDLSGMQALVVGRSGIVGAPIAALLTDANCTVTLAHSKTKNLPEECQRADILIAAIGRPEFIKGKWIKPGAIVIDVGINRVRGEGGKSRLVGDVEFNVAKKNAKAITPVPGGVGPMTIACLLRNTIGAACKQNGLDAPFTN